MTNTPTTDSDHNTQRDNYNSRLLRLLNDNGISWLDAEGDLFDHLGKLGRNVIALNKAITYWQQLGDDMHAQAHQDLTKAMHPDPGNGSFTNDFLPETVTSAVKYHAADLSDNAYLISGHYRRELATIEKYCAKNYGPDWQEVLWLAAERLELD